jgi:hypothetical protein
MGDVVNFNGATRLDIDPDPVLQAAVGKLKQVVILGYTEDGQEYFASSIADGGTVLWMFERCKQVLINTDDED